MARRASAHTIAAVQALDEAGTPRAQIARTLDISRSQRLPLPRPTAAVSPEARQATYPSKVTEENGDTQGCSSSAPAELDDWPFDDPSVDVARLRESLMQSESDIAAGRTFGEDEIRARYGVPRK